MCSSRSQGYIHNMPFCLTEFVQCVSCFSTHHEYSPTQNLKATRVFLITKNTLHQLDLLEKNCNPAFLGNKNFTKDKNGNRPLDRSIGKVTILHFLNAQFKMRHKATEYNKPCA